MNKSNVAGGGGNRRAGGGKGKAIYDPDNDAFGAFFKGANNNNVFEAISGYEGAGGVSSDAVNARNNDIVQNLVNAGTNVGQFAEVGIPVSGASVDKKPEAVVDEGGQNGDSSTSSASASGSIGTEPGSGSGPMSYAEQQIWAKDYSSGYSPTENALVVKNETIVRDGKEYLVETLSDGTTREKFTGNIAESTGGGGPASIDLAATPGPPPGDVDQSAVDRFSGLFKSDYDKLISEGRYDGSAIGSGFRASGGGNANASTLAAIRENLASYADQATQAGITASGALGGQQSIEDDTREEFLGNLIDRDNSLQVNQQQALQNMVTGANQAGADAVAGLNLPDSTQISPLEQSLQDAMMGRVNTDDFFSDIDDSMAVSAEKKAKKRLDEESFLGDVDEFRLSDVNSILGAQAEKALTTGGLLGMDTDLGSAMQIARNRMNQEKSYLGDSTKLDSAMEAAKTELAKENYLGESTDLDSAMLAANTELAKENYLGKSDNDDLGAAMKSARDRLDKSGISADSDMMTRADSVLMQRLLGGTNPMIEAQKAEYLANADKDEAQLRENLNRMGVLRSGDSAEMLGDFYGQRGRGVNDIDSLGYQMQSQALADALGYQGRRDNISLANEDLSRAAISDVSGLASQYDQRGIAESGLRQDAIGRVASLAGQYGQRGIAESGLRQDAIGRVASLAGQYDERSLAEQNMGRAAREDVVGIQGRMDDRTALEQALQGDLVSASMGVQGRYDDMARSEQDLQRAAISDAMQMQGRRDNLGAMNQDLQRSAIGDALGYQGMRDNRDLAQAGMRMDAQGLGQRISDSELNRSLVQTGPSQRELFAETQRQNQIGNVLAQGDDTRATSALEDSMSGTDLQRRIAEAGVTGQYFTGNTGYMGSPEQVQTEQSKNNALNRLLSEAGITGKYKDADTMAREQLTDSKLGTDLQRRLSEAGVTGSYDTGTQAGSKDTLQSQEFDLRKLLAEAGVTGQYGEDETMDSRRLTDQLAASQQGRDMGLASVTGMYGDRETIQQQGLTDQLAGSALQRDLAAAGVTGKYGDDETLASQSLTAQLASNKLRDDLAAAGVTGKYGADETLASKSLTGQLASNTLQDKLAQAATTGKFDDADTIAQQNLTSSLAGVDLQRALAAAGVSGKYDGNDTIAQQALTSQLANEGLTRDLKTASVTGRMGEADTLEKTLGIANLTGNYGTGDDAVRTLSGQATDIAESGVTGTYQGDPTRQTSNELIDQILSMANEDMNQDGKYNAFIGALGDQFGQDNLLSVALRDALGLEQQGDNHNVALDSYSFSDLESKGISKRNGGYWQEVGQGMMPAVSINEATALAIMEGN